MRQLMGLGSDQTALETTVSSPGLDNRLNDAKVTSPGFSMAPKFSVMGSAITSSFSYGYGMPK